MARVLALVADLLFGSQVKGALEADGNEVELLGAEGLLRRRLDDSSTAPPGVLVVDLTDAALDGAGVVESLARDGALAGTRTLGFYSHVDVAARRRAEEAGFDLVVARSRMAREGALLVRQLGARGKAPPR